MPLGAGALRQGQGRQSSEDRRGRDRSHGPYTDQPHWAPGQGQPCSRHHRSTDPSPPAPAVTAQSCGHLLCAGSDGQGTFWCWWVQIQESISQTFPLHSLEQDSREQSS